MDSGPVLAFNIRKNRHLDYGYAATSHSSQGQTTDRVLVHVDTEQAGEKLVNRRLAYVAVSRGRYDAQIYTDDKTALAGSLSRDASHETAIGHVSRSELVPENVKSSQTVDRVLERTRERDIMPSR